MDLHCPNSALIDNSQRPDITWGVLISTVVYLVYLVVDRIYKLYLHPLAKFPGPPEACLSKKWLLRVSEEGNPERVFEKLHEKYNSKAIRIAPNELHIDDVKMYKQIYNQTATYTKEPDFYAGFGTPHSVFVEHDPNLHKQRRRLLNPYFSRRAIGEIENLLKDKVEQLGKRIDRQNGPYNIFNAVRCTTADIISHYCTGKSLGQLDSSDENFNGDFLDAFNAVSASIWKFMYQPILRRFMFAIPSGIAKTVSRDTRVMMKLNGECYKAALNFKQNPPKSSHGIVLSSLSHLDEKEMGAETAVLLVAGSDTTAYTLAAAVVQICQNNQVKKKLVESLNAGIPDVNNLPSLSGLEQIAYLNATVREALRFAIAAPGRLPRVVPRDSKPLVVDDQVIPAGSIIGMSAYTMNFSKELWGKDAAEFNPDRWLGEDGKSLDTNMCSFSKGLRNCLGQNLALAEMHYILAYLFAKYDIELVDKSDNIEVRDRFSTYVMNHAIMVDMKKHKV
ncbi:Cytochrome P450 monooxygenase yanH [Fusarium culmorum]|uniref:Cytochrome P450 monooxygenase yanH n=1 Tax=Fusarium culmorum TaxID=5516 RepID=A0A2T4H7X7_FUSCU|nr:Cytochrome P450 monooxygenase yanH [Fusarium culmorum]